MARPSAAQEQAAIVPPEVPAKKRTQSLSAFKHQAFRLFFGGQLISVTGTWMQIVAQQIVVYQLSGSSFVLGLVACAQGLPSLILTPLAGVLIERLSRRKMLMVAQIWMMLLALIMAALHFTGVLQIWHIVLLSLGVGMANALDAPARLAFVVEMVGREDLSSGIVMNSVMFNTARVIGPAVGGLALSALGPSWCFLLNGLSFLAVIASLGMMRIAPVVRNATRIAIWQPLVEGLRFARHHPTIAPLLVLASLTSTFGLTYTVLLPPFADKVLGDTEVGTSALLTAFGIGAFVASIFITQIAERGFRGRVVYIAAHVAPVALIALAFTQTIALAALMALIAGFAYICQFILTNTLIQLEVPDEFRGRVLSLYTITFFGFTPFGSLALGLMGQSMGTVAALLIFATINLIGAWAVLRNAMALRQLP